MLQKGVYPYEYIGSLQRFLETSLPDKKKFYSNLAMENITDAEYKHVKRVREDFGIHNVGDYMIYKCRVVHYYRQMHSKTFVTNA